MRRYSADDEERVTAQFCIREWERSGLLESSQSARLEAELQVDLRRTNNFLRGVLFLFTGLIVAASVLLTITVFDLDDELLLATTTGIAGILFFALLECLVSRFRLYRFGVEEAFAVAAAVLLSVSGAAIASTLRGNRPGEFPALVALCIGALSAFGIYRRFGYVYAAFAAMICAAGIPFQMALSAEVQRFLVAAMLTLVFVVVRSKRLQNASEPGDEYGIIQASAWAGLYFVLNLQISFGRIEGWFYWGTYVMIWFLPIIGLRLALRVKDRALMDVSLAMALVTLATNKPYLGLSRQPWDPILLGIFLMAAVITLRRWLSKGPDSRRYGFTPVRLLTGDSRLLTFVSTASAAFQPEVPAPTSAPGKPDFSGGRSGGAGASGSF